MFEDIFEIKNDNKKLAKPKIKNKKVLAKEFKIHDSRYFDNKCPGCGSTNIMIIGAHSASNKKFDDWRCDDCGFTWSVVSK